MGKIEQVMRVEIVRLARKQVKSVVAPLKRELRAVRGAIKALRLTVSQQEQVCRAQNVRLAQIAAGATSAPTGETAAEKQLRISPLLIKKLRKRLKLTQGRLAKLLGVSAATVVSWEKGRTRPDGGNRAKLAALRATGLREIKARLAELSPGKSAPAKTHGRKRGRSRKV